MRIALTATPSQARFAPILLRGGMDSVFALAAELGYDGVEIHLHYPSDIDWAATRRLSVDYGLGVPTLGTGMAAGEDGLTFPDPDPEIRRRAVERVREHIALAAHLGAAVTLGSLNGRLGADPQQRLSRRAAAMACLEECCQAAAAAGVTMLLEPLNRYESDYLNTLDDVRNIIDELGAPNLKLLADTFHMNIEEVDIAASLRRAGPLLGHLHLVDSNRQAPGHGHLDIPSVLQALRDIDYQGYVSFEALPLPDPRQATEDGIRAIRGMLQDL